MIFFQRYDEVVGEHDLEIFETILDAIDRHEEIPLGAWSNGMALYAQLVILNFQFCALNESKNLLKIL